MANVIQIKRSSSTSVPSTLAVGELAYSEASDKLFIGESGNVVTQIGGGAAMIKLAAIEAGATADMTGAEIKVAYEGEANTNAFTDTLLSKLNGIEAGATADQTDAEIKTAYENNANTNAFTDSEKSKLAGIETAADVTDSTNVAAAGAVMTSDTDASSYLFVIDEDSMATDSATKVPTQQSVKAYVDTEIADAVSAGVRYQGSYNASTNSPDLDTSPSSSITKGDMYTVTTAGTFFTVSVEIGDMLISNQDTPTTEAHWTVVQANLDAASIKTNYESNSDTNAFTDALLTKLNGIETGAEVNLTDAEVKTAYENNSDTNAFTDALLTKLNAIETGATADQTASEIKTAYESNSNTNAFTDTLLTKLNNIASNADLYSSWTVSDGSNSENISSGHTVEFEGSGSVSTSYDTSTNTLTITGTDTVDYVSGASFNSTSGVLTLTGTGNAGATVDLDGRYFIIDTTVLDGGTF